MGICRIDRSFQLSGYVRVSRKQTLLLSALSSNPPFHAFSRTDNMQEFQEDFYALLGVEESSSPEEIRKAYLKLAKKLHPDRFPNDPEKRAEAQEQFSKVTRAHDVLSDPKQREEYEALRMLAKSKGAAAEVASPAAGATPATAEGRDQWAEKHCERALDLLRKKRFPEAETAIKEAIRLCPNNANYHATLADIQYSRGWKTLAQSTVQQALKIDPKNHEAKTIELKLKASAAGKSTGPQKKSDSGDKKGFLDQLKDLLGKKV